MPKLLETLYQKATHIYKIQMNIILFNSKIVTITTLSPPPSLNMLFSYIDQNGLVTVNMPFSLKKKYVQGLCSPSCPGTL